MVTSTTTGRKASSVRNLFSQLFGLAAIPLPNVGRARKVNYTVAVVDGIGFSQESRVFNVESSDSPASLALRMIAENPALAGKRVWIHDPTLNNRFPHRFRLFIDNNNEPRARLIEPRRR
jgi:hypothetical protein